jgi:hypothetical protein
VGCFASKYSRSRSRGLAELHRFRKLARYVFFRVWITGRQGGRTLIRRPVFRMHGDGQSSLGLQFGYAKQKRGNVFEEMTRSLGNGIDNCS